jgi:endonuclease YncB( thermonuclease family)
LTGDRFVVLDANSRERRIRIYGTSAPKLDQDLGIESKENLAKLILGKNVLVQTRRTEPGGEILGDVMIDGRNVGLDQLRAGLVRLVEEEVLELNAEQQRVFAEADNAAKNAAIGLWARSADGTPLINSTASSYNAPLQAFRTSGPAAQAATGADAAETAPAGETVEVTEMPVQKPVTESQPGAPTPAPVESVVVPPQDSVKPADSRAAASTPPAAKPGPKVYTRGPRGGCFFISASGNKTYVDRSLCN